MICLILILLLSGGCAAPAMESVVPDKAHDREETVTPARQERQMKIAAVGDIMIGRGVGMKLKKEGYTKPFDSIKPYLDADLAIGNLECVLSDRGKETEGKGICLRARPEAVRTLTYLGFDALSLANNHTMDYGGDALKDTMDVLRENGISYMGAGDDIGQARTAYTKDVNGIKTTVLSYDQFYNIRWTKNGRSAGALEDRCGTAPLDMDMVKEDIAKAKETADVVIVMPHWGTEDSTVVTKDQIGMAHDMIDAGADAVIGSHPHILQGMEVYKGRLIAYSMGNFVFDQNDRENQESIVLNLKFTGCGLDEAVITPLVIVDKVSPVPAAGDRAKEILGRLKDLSQELGADVSVEGDTGSIKFTAD
mgnify:CR=1 FL=1